MIRRLNFSLLSCLAMCSFACAQDSILMTCTQHGDNNMTLTFTRETGSAREVVIRGVNNATKWTVLVDDEDVTPQTQTDDNPGAVVLHPGDEVTFEVADGLPAVVKHGILFKTEDEARSFFEFDEDEGKDLDDRDDVDGYEWGTEKMGADTVLAFAEVKSIPPTPAPTSANNPLANMFMPGAMIVPSCAGGNYLIAPSMKDRSRILATRLVDSSTEDADATILGLSGPNRWADNEEEAQVGEEIAWVIGSGFHGVRITNWEDIKDHVEIVEAFGDLKSFLQNGENSQATATADTVLLRLRVKSLPDDEVIEYDCIIHGSRMSGSIAVSEDE